jgi:hypothetical protein
MMTFIVVGITFLVTIISIYYCKPSQEKKDMLLVIELDKNKYNDEMKDAFTNDDVFNIAL